MKTIKKAAGQTAASVKTRPIYPHILSFAGAVKPFDTRTEAKQFIKAEQKRSADRRGTFKAVIVRIAVDREGIQ